MDFGPNSIDKRVGVEEYDINSNILYPNPFEHTLIVKNTDPTMNNITISDLSGNVVYESAFDNEIMQIDTKTWLSGVYVVLLKGDKGKSEVMKCIRL